MSTVNLYDVLNVKPTADAQEIKKAYRELVKQFHPDRPKGDAEMFELITYAYNILYNKKSRADYDKLNKMADESTSDHNRLKKRFDDIIKSEKESTTKISKKERKKEFKKQMEEMDRKHGFDHKKKEKALSAKELRRKADDLCLARDQEEIELKPEQLLDINCSGDKFNAMFEAMYRGPMDIVPHDGNPTAFNSLDGADLNYSTLDSMNDLYNDGDVGFSSNFGSVNFYEGKKKKLTREDVNKLKPVDYFKNHNQIEDDYKKKLRRMMDERDLETAKYDERTYADFDNDPKCGGYGFLHQLGINDFGALEWNNDDEDLKKRYKRLLDERKN